MFAVPISARKAKGQLSSNTFFSTWTKILFCYIILFKFHGNAGKEPLVVARGGFSGVFPDSSEFAVDMATTTSMTDVAIWCDLQLTKDGQGICQPDIRLDNTTNIADVFPKRESTYNVNGQSLKGWFAVDFTFDEIFNNVTCIPSFPFWLTDYINLSHPT